MFFIITILVMVLLAVFYGGYYIFGHFYGSKITYDPNYAQYVPKVSLVIASYNEKDNIHKKIQNIELIDYPDDKLEVVVVDSSTDGTRDIIKKWMAKSNIKIRLVEENSRLGLATALNTGYALADGEVVIKTDADMALDKYSIHEIVKYFVDLKIGAVSGAVKISNKSELECGYRSLFEKFRAAESNLDSTYLFNPFSAFRKSLIVPINLKSVADDAELALKIRLQGYRTVYSPTAITYENSPASFKSRLNQKSRRAQGHICLILQNLKVLFNPKYGKFGLMVFPANVFMMLLSPWILLSLIPLSFLSLIPICGIIYAFIFTFLIVSIILSICLTATPKALASFLDAQINLIVGFFQLILKGPDFKWTKTTRD